MIKNDEEYVSVQRLPTQSVQRGSVQLRTFPLQIYSPLNPLAHVCSLQISSQQVWIQVHFVFWSGTGPFVWHKSVYTVWCWSIKCFCEVKTCSLLILSSDIKLFIWHLFVRLAQIHSSATYLLARDLCWSGTNPFIRHKSVYLALIRWSDSSMIRSDGTDLVIRDLFTADHFSSWKICSAKIFSVQTFLGDEKYIEECPPVCKWSETLNN